MTDPTRIEIETDPLTMGMRGYTAYGNIPFNVPYISEIANNLYMGGCEDGLVLPEFIEHLVCLYPWEQYKVKHELHTSLKIKMYDSVDQSFELVDELARWVNACRKTGPTLTNCQAGLNRSGLVVARALMLEGMTADEAIELIREKRSPACLCNPVFEKWLRSG